MITIKKSHRPTNNTSETQRVFNARKEKACKKKIVVVKRNIWIISADSKRRSLRSVTKWL